MDLIFPCNVPLERLLGTPKYTYFRWNDAEHAKIVHTMGRGSGVSRVHQ